MAASTLPDVIDGLIRKTDLLARHIDVLEQTNAELKAKIALLEEQLAEERQNANRARLDADYLTVSHRLADSPDTIIATRRRISSLIRTIDRCISMLKDDPEI
ncbi:MAG: hypothetical protein HDR95_07570 [Bacteroides sp.]|nr:hypothetical protein [Bacteroidales bacterium]MBD5337151.1 hypothetical protein [Bacteroides sp.]